MNKNLFTGFMIASMFFILVLFFQTCSVNSKINTVQDNNTTLQHTVDSFIVVEAAREDAKIIPATPKQVKDEMQRVMFDFLVYEDDLDKGRTSLSTVKSKIEEDDEK